MSQEQEVKQAFLRAVEMAQQLIQPEDQLRYEAWLKAANEWAGDGTAPDVPADDGFEFHTYDPATLRRIFGGPEPSRAERYEERGFRRGYHYGILEVEELIAKRNTSAYERLIAAVERWRYGFPKGSWTWAPALNGGEA